MPKTPPRRKPAAKKKPRPKSAPRRPKAKAKTARASRPKTVPRAARAQQPKIVAKAARAQRPAAGRASTLATRFSREELEAAFQRYWRCGAVGENWDAWADRFTENATYVEHVLGNLQGREAIRGWIKPIMALYPEIYTAYEWHMVDPETGRVCVYMQNRRDHPSGQGTIDFPGITILQYAGNGRFDFEEDFWAVPQAQRTLAEYREACAQHDPDHPQRQSRHDWGKGPAWTRGGASYAERPPAPTR